MLRLNQHNALVITTLLGYGDLLYLTPFLRFLKKAGFIVDVWAFNTEPFINNPDINILSKVSTTRVIVPDHYFCHYIFQKFGDNSNNIHTIDYYPTTALRINLRDKEKDLILRWTSSDFEFCESLLKQHNLISNRSPGCNFVVISPAITWPSRTLPLPFYQDLIKRIQNNGDKVVLVGKSLIPPESPLVGKEIAQEEIKRLYPASHFPGVIDFTDKFTFHQLCAFYSLCKLAINSENGNMVASCTNPDCWNIYIPTLNAPDFRLPWRRGFQQYRSLVVANDKDYFPTADYQKFVVTTKTKDLKCVMDAPVLLPKVEDVFHGYLKVNNAFQRGLDFLYAESFTPA